MLAKIASDASPSCFDVIFSFWALSSPLCSLSLCGIYWLLSFIHYIGFCYFLLAIACQKKALPIVYLFAQLQFAQHDGIIAFFHAIMLDDGGVADIAWFNYTLPCVCKLKLGIACFQLYIALC